MEKTLDFCITFFLSYLSPKEIREILITACCTQETTENTGKNPHFLLFSKYPDATSKGQLTSVKGVNNKLQEP